MTPRSRKVLLTLHIICSVGWFGAVAAFLALSVVGMSSLNPDLVRGVYLSMDLISRFVVIPLSLAALTTGLTQALASPWGLLRYYWIALKFGLALFAAFALIVHQLAVVSVMAQRVTSSPATALFGPDLASLKFELVRAPALALVVLLSIATLAVFKPWGLTPFGQRTSQQSRTQPQGQPTRPMPSGVKLILSILGVLVAVVIGMHLAGHGFHHGH